MEPTESSLDTLRRTELPTLGTSIPRRGNRLTRIFFTLLLRLMGWRVVGQLPDLPRLVFVGAPHTSNGDFFMTALTMAALGIDVHFVMKHTPFVGPVGWFLRWFGGIPLDRDHTRDFVSQMVDVFDSREQFLLAIMPEGTRSVVKGWRSGFYHIAHNAGVPLVMVKFDYPNRRMRVGPVFWPSGDYETELPLIQAEFADIAGRHPELMLAMKETTVAKAI
ncbi:MAG TPA: lysophospholipid acyltransferase family protein [Promineifilum sp.]|nr:lysophospholipid acyltransferase family protein [Promineifilum sp.]